VQEMISDFIEIWPIRWLKRHRPLSSRRY